MTSFIVNFSRAAFSCLIAAIFIIVFIALLGIQDVRSYSSSDNIATSHLNAIQIIKGKTRSTREVTQGKKLIN